MEATRYSTVMIENKDKVFNLPLSAWEVGLLHGAVRLMMMHPEVAGEYSEAFKNAARDVRTKCLAYLADMGFTPEEIEELNSEVA